MTGFNFPDGGYCPQIDRIDVTELAANFGTPTYVYVAETIAARVDQLRQFDVVRYAQKANANLGVLDHLRRLGVLVDAVSAGEILRARAAGFEPNGEPPPIVYTADVFDRDALQLVTKLEIHVNFGSPDMIEQYGECNRGRNVTLRINPGFGHGHSQKTNTGGPQSKHGIWHEQLGECLTRCAAFGLCVVGLHMHIGSGTDFEHLSQVCSAMEGCADAVGPSLRTISAGGGLPTPYRFNETPLDIDRYFKIWNETRMRLQKRFGHPLTLELEPGRFPVAESGFLIAEIRAIKKMGANKFYLLDAGFNNLARPILYGAYHPMAIARRDGTAGPGLNEVVVGGPLCESGDIFTQSFGGTVEKRQLPVAKVGDFLVIGCAGAYGFVMSSNYNSRPLAAEVLVRDGIAELIRPRQSLESLFESERIPG